MPEIMLYNTPPCIMKMCQEFMNFLHCGTSPPCDVSCMTDHIFLARGKREEREKGCGKQEEQEGHVKREEKHCRQGHRTGGSLQSRE